MERVGVAGAGSIGVAWAIVFARAGFEVALWDPDAERRAAVSGELARKLEALYVHGLIEESPATVSARVQLHPELGDVVAGSCHVQESAPELAELKRSLFAELDGIAAPDTVLASSSSALPCSSVAAHLEGRARCLVAHPANPPYLLPVVELVPAPFTSTAALADTEALLRSAGMSPVVVRGEPEGFVLNRLQGAVLREAYCLVRDGVVAAGDLDRVMREGLGRRWGVLGPFETSELNTRGGIEAHATRLGPAYARMGAERGQHDPWTPELVGIVATAVHRRLSPERWDDNVDWRDAALMVLERARRDHPEITRPPGADRDSGG